jgi:glycogen debranching enzyme
VVEVVARELYAGPGLRSLAPGHPDYHPIYLGALSKRDAAYHQGTAWGFLMGGFITAYTKVHNHSEASIRQALEYLAPVREQFYDGGIGTISEIFDGDAPHHCRGCYAQAWSVGEVLRCYTEDILK